MARQRRLVFGIVLMVSRSFGADAMSGVNIAPRSFDPSRGQQTEVTFSLGLLAQVSISVIGPNGEVVCDVGSASTLTAGGHSVQWAGTDSAGAALPNEAYTFAIQVQSPKDGDVTAQETITVYDSRGASGGELMNPQDFLIRADDNLIDYVLPKPCRVRIRGGIDNGPMLSTIVNWEPRTAGLVTEVWRGQDKQSLRSFSKRPDAFLTEMAYALPDNAVITYGNKDVTYAEWYEKVGKNLPHRPRPQRKPDAPGVMCPHWFFPPHLAADPDIVVSFPEIEGYKESALKKDASGSPQPAVIGGDSVLVRVSIPSEAHLKFLLERQFEVVVFVDDQRIFEAEQSAAPFNFRWDVSMLSSGLHYLTINVVSAADQVGTFTAPVELKRERKPSEDSEPNAGSPPPTP